MTQLWGENGGFHIDGKSRNPSFDSDRIDAIGMAKLGTLGLGELFEFVQEGRVNGSLALSRAIGDLEYKQSKNLPAKDQVVTAYPEIRECVIEPGDEFMVIACDGIWDVLTSQQCVDYVRARLDADVQLSKICEELADECMAPDTKGSGIGCDNMSVVIVLLKDTAFVPGADGKPTLRPRSAF